MTTIDQIKALMELAKKATPPENYIYLRWLEDSFFDRYDFIKSANPRTIHALCSTLLEAIEIIQELKSTAETHAMQSYSKTSWKNVEKAQEFLKKVGVE